MGDEVGGNLNMTGDGHSGDQLFLTGSKQVPYQRVSTTEKRFTMIGLTGLDGTPEMCVLIIQGKKRNLSIETGINITVQTKGELTGKSFFFENCGTSKYFPGPSSCLRTYDVKPFLLFDGHQSRLGLTFLQYINTPSDYWVVCIGVPYGTAL